MLIIKNRRQGPDTKVLMITGFSILTWLVIIAVIIIYQMSNPSQAAYIFLRENIIGSDAGIIIGKIMFLVNFFLSIFGMIMNSRRNKRKSDKFRVSLILSTIISFGGFIALMVIF